MAGLGGAIKLKGESEYQRALKQIKQNLREVSSEMKAVSSSFDKNDNSTSALNAKSQVLNKTLDAQKQKLKTLQSQYADFSAKMAQQTANHEKLVNTYNNEKKKLEELGRTLGTSSKEYQDQKAKVEQLAQAVSKSSKNQDANAKSMSEMRVQMNNAQADINKTTRSLDELGKEAEESGKQAKSSGDGFTVMKGVLSNLATDAIHLAVDGLKQLGGAFINVGKQAYESYSQYEQLVGGVDTLFGAGGKTLEEYAASVGQSVDQAKGKYDELTEASNMVQKNAANAFSTAGMSANQYMEQVTGFSATLIQGLNGDTKKAAKVADVAIRDMADNANKMGTSMTDIQNAYQGFAKDNYTMLDNLKLGYGGTQSEMARLINDSGVLGDSVKVTAETVKDVPFDQVIEAIHEVQDNLGIVGTTSDEAARTLEGSTMSMKAAWQNLLTGMADDNANFSGLIDNLVNSVVAVANNMIPRIQQIIKGMAQVASELLITVVPQLVQEIPQLLSDTLPILIDAVASLIQTVLEVLPQMMPVIVDGIMQIVQSMISMLPEFINAGLQMLTSLIQGITNALPQLIAMLPTIIKQIVDTIMANLPAIIEAGIQLIVALIEGLAEAIPQIIDMLPEIVITIGKTLIECAPEILAAGVQLIVALAKGLAESIPKVVAVMPKIIVAMVKAIGEGLSQLLAMGGKLIVSLVKGIGGKIGHVGGEMAKVGKAIINGIKHLPSAMVNWGKDMIQGLVNGIKSMIGAVGDAVAGVANKIKNFLHFSRPDEGPLREYEEWMPDMINGLSASLEKASPSLINQTKALAKGMSDSLKINGSVNGNINGVTTTGYSSDLVGAFKQALSEMKIEMDGDEMGKFVDRTVTNLVYA